MTEIDIRTVSTAALAYFGDGVIELFVRHRLVKQGYGSSKSLNSHARAFVSAPAQAAAKTFFSPLPWTDTAMPSS